MTSGLLYAVVGCLLFVFGLGGVLLLDHLLRRILAFNLMGSGAFLVLVGLAQRYDVADPLPQAMVLTAIVIALATAAFLVTMAYRSFQLNGHDEVADDVEDARIRALALADEASDSFEEIRFSDTGVDVVSE